jgi:hypothetical protein
MELIIVILLISTIYLLVFSSFSFKKEKKYKVSLENIKEFMIKNFEYEKELSLVCIEDETKDCFILIDKEINKDIQVDNLFKEIPEVYYYGKDLNSYEFEKIRFDNVEFEPFFELTINSDRKHKNIIVDMGDENIYLIKSISNKAKKYKNTNEIIEEFFENEIEVRDAL